jgi:hypothetical protein
MMEAHCGTDVEQKCKAEVGRYKAELARCMADAEERCIAKAKYLELELRKVAEGLQ